jgi:hypothetical protein
MCNQGLTSIPFPALFLFHRRPLRPGGFALGGGLRLCRGRRWFDDFGDLDRILQSGGEGRVTDTDRQGKSSIGMFSPAVRRCSIRRSAGKVLEGLALSEQAAVQ